MKDILLAVVASGFVLILVADLIGNYIHFTSRVFNALVTSIIWVALFAVLNWVYYHYPRTAEDGSVYYLPLLQWTDFPLWALVGWVLAFVSDLIGNTIAFKSPYRNSLVTGCIWAVGFLVVTWFFTEIGYL
jgi:ABC-type enterochelin transport system permease subunit